MEEPVERLDVGCRGLRIALHRFTGKEQPEHRTHTIHAEGHAMLLRSSGHTVGKPYCPLGQIGVEPRRLNQLQHGKTRSHGHRITRQRTRLVDRARRRHLLHEVATTAIGTHRHAAADDLAEAGEVGGNAVVSLRTTQGHAEAGHHLVEDQQHAMLAAQLAQCLEIARLRRDAVHVACDRLDDEAGDVLAFLREEQAGGVDIVIRQGEREVGGSLGHARRRRHAESERAGPGLYQEAVAMAVVAAFELHDLRAARGAAGEADGRHRGLRARIDHAHHLHRGHQLYDGLGHRHFGGAGRAERQAVAHGALHGFAHGRMIVADDHRTPRAHVVDVPLALHVPQISAIGALGKERLAADRFEGAHGRIHAARQQLAGAGEEFVVRGHRVVPVKRSAKRRVADWMSAAAKMAETTAR